MQDPIRKIPKTKRAGVWVKCRVLAWQAQGTHSIAFGLQKYWSEYGFHSNCKFEEIMSLFKTSVSSVMVCAL
jgi:hypothetical protein